MTELITPRRAHYCEMPTVTRTMTPPFLDDRDPDPQPVSWQAVPDVGAVWQCECGIYWRVQPPRQYANMVSFINEWQRCSRWAYRRAVRLAGKEPR